MRSAARLSLTLPLAAMTLVGSLVSCSGASNSASPLIVYAASSMQHALDEIGRDYRKSGGDSVVMVFGSTTDLAEQIANGAPADLLLAADETTIATLADRDLIVESTRVVYAVGQLALVIPCARAARGNVDSGASSCATASLPDLVRSDIRFIAIANPAYAPYGAAARQVLEHEGLWDRVESKIVMAANIVQADQYVTSGNADAGLIALSLVIRNSERAYVVVDQSLYEPLRHAAGVITRSARAEPASRFLQFIMSDRGQAILHRYGFTSPESIARR